MAGCANPVDKVANGDLATIVRAYKKRCRQRLQDQLASFSSEPTVSAAVRRAGLAIRPDGKRYPHQRRLPSSVLRAAGRRLLKVPVEAARDFDELHRIVANAIGTIPGIGELMIYDTALRIGARLGVWPREVYLHSGTRQGARALGLDWRLTAVPVATVPHQLRELEPHEIEDCLCIFKDRLQTRRSNTALHRTARSSGARRR